MRKMARVKTSTELVIKTNPVVYRENFFGFKKPKIISVKQNPAFGVEYIYVIIGFCLIVFVLITLVI